MKYFFAFVMVLVLMSGPAFAADAFSIHDEVKKVTGDEQVIPDPNVILQGGDDCGDFFELTGNLPITSTGTTSGYSNDYGPYSVEPNCWQGSFYTSSNGAADVVYKFTAPATSTYDFSLCGSGYDTGLSLYYFTCPSEPTMDDFICGNDDSDACGLQSELLDIALEAGDEVLVVVDGYSTASGNYTLTIDADLPAFGACCVGMDCVGNYGVDDCNALGGVLYNGEDCASFSCPEPGCLAQAPNMSNGIFSDLDCDLCGSGIQVVAENFNLSAETNISALTFWGGYYPANNNMDDCFTVIFREDLGGTPGDEIGRIDCVMADEKEDTGRDLFGVNEYIYTINTEAVLPAGTFFVEILNNTEGNGDSWFWEVGDFDADNGVMGSAWSTSIPEDPWNYDTVTDMALELTCGGGSEETQVYFENFDSGMGAWAGGWAITTEDAYSTPNSMTDSPGGNYADNVTVSVQMTSDIDLTSYFGARLEFMTKFELEQGFDYVYSYISTNGGNSWIDLHTFNGEDNDDYTWHPFVADLGGFVGQSIRFKFTLVSDAGYNVDGMYIDDFAVYGLNVDNSPPLILHNGPDDMTAIPEDFTAIATITDVSGVESTWLSYAVDGSDMEVANPDSSVGDDYYFTIPQVEAGAHVEYFISASDNQGNEGSGGMEHYISGTMIYYDDGDPEFVYQFAPGNKVATRFTPSETANLVTGLIRLYTDVDRPIDSVDVQVWANGSGNMPGTPMIDPMAVWSAATLGNPQAFTYVDFRGMGITVSNDFHIGYTYRTEWPVILGDSPAISGRSNVFMGGSWAPGTCDFHLRAVVDYAALGIGDNDNLVPDNFSLKQNYPNPFNASTVIEYAIKNPGEVELSVFNVLGQKVASLAKGHHDAGTYSITWNANDVPSGVYFARVESSGHSESVKMVLLK